MTEAAVFAGPPEDKATLGARLRAIWSIMRAQGVQITVDQLAAAESLALAHLTGAPLPGGEASLRRMIGGVFAKNGADRAVFDTLWSGFDQVPPPDSLDAPPTGESGRPAPPPRTRRLRKGDVPWIAMLSLAQAVTLAALLFVTRLPEVVMPPPPPVRLVQSAELTVETQVVPLAAATATPPAWWRYARVAAPAVPLALAVLVLAWRAAAAMRRNGERHRDTEDRLEAFASNWQSISLFDGAVTRMLGRSLRRASAETTQDLDARRTVEATADRAGAFTPVFRSVLRNRTPILIQRLSAYDHLAALFRQAVRRVEAAGAAIEPAYFRGGIQRLTRENGQSVSLGELSGPSAGVLVVVGSADAVIAARGQSPEAGLRRTLGQWTSRVLLNTTRLRYWGSEEEELLRTGFDISPATPASLGSVAERVLSGAGGGQVFGVGRRTGDAAAAGPG